MVFRVISDKLTHGFKTRIAAGVGCHFYIFCIITYLAGFREVIDVTESIKRAVLGRVVAERIAADLGHVSGSGIQTIQHPFMRFINVTAAEFQIINLRRADIQWQIIRLGVGKFVLKAFRRLIAAGECQCARKCQHREKYFFHSIPSYSLTIASESPRGSSTHVRSSLSPFS